MSEPDDFFFHNLFNLFITPEEKRFVVFYINFYPFENIMQMNIYCVVKLEIGTAKRIDRQCKCDVS